MTLGLIWAQAANGVIGHEGRLPWRLPEDLAHFRDVTMGSTVVMGRATWESLPATVRPLPGRRNVVLSRRPGWLAPGATVASDLSAALAGADRDVWVIGGAAVFAAAAPLAGMADVTELAEAFPGDVYAPSLGPEWRLVTREPASGWTLSASGLHYRTTRYAAERV